MIDTREAFDELVLMSDASAFFEGGLLGSVVPRQLNVLTADA